MPRRNNLDTNIFHIVHEWLGTRDEDWIIVLDDVNDDLDLPQIAPPGGLESMPDDENRAPFKWLQSFLPRSLNGSVLVTTRNLTVAMEAATDGGFIEIGPMEEPLAMAPFQRQLDEDEVRSLAHKLLFNPLAIVQGAHYIKYRAPQLSVSWLHDELDARQSIEHTFSPLDALHGTLQIVFDDIKRERPTAFDLLSLMSFFDPHKVPKSLLHNIQVHEEPGEHKEVLYMEERFDIDIAGLNGLSLIYMRQDTKSMAIHSLVQRNLRY